MLGIDERFDPPPRFGRACDQLHQIATEESGHADFGDGCYLPGLRVLLESMDYDPRFSTRGRRIAWGNLVNTLAARAHAVQAMKSSPAFRTASISAPVVITGLHRTGTTALHKLLSVDPRFQGLESWLTATPMPRPPRAEWSSHSGYRKVLQQLEARFEAASGLRAAHAMAAEEVDECGAIMCQNFTSIVWTVAWSASSYDAWWQCQNEEPAYRWLRQSLQLIGLHEPEKRWLLKHPPHIANLDLLFDAFPDARVVQTHRDPGLAIPSLCSLIMKNHATLEDGRADQRARLMGPRLTGWASQAIRRAEHVRAAKRDQVFDVIHSDFHADPMATIRAIYAFARMQLTPQVESAMRARISKAPESAHGNHTYDVADYGMSADEIREAFGDYVQRFDLAPTGNRRSKS
jgi:hypothetical protein